MSLLDTYNTIFTQLATVSGLHVYTEETRNRDIEYPFCQVYLDGEDNPTNFSTFKTEMTTLEITLVVGEKVDSDISETSKRTANQNLITRTKTLMQLIGLKVITKTEYKSSMIDNEFVRISLTTGTV